MPPQPTNRFPSISRRSRSREADALLDCRSIDPHDTAGEINIEACGCVLAPRAQAALFVVTADAFPEPLLHEVKWTGQGSVVAGQVVFGRWYRRDPEFRAPASGKRLTMPRSRLPVWSGAWSSLQEDSTETLPTARSSTARRRCRTPNPPGPPYEPCRRRSSRRVGQASVAMPAHQPREMVGRARYAIWSHPTVFARSYWPTCSTSPAAGSRIPAAASSPGPVGRPVGWCRECARRDCDRSPR